MNWNNYEVRGNMSTLYPWNSLVSPKAESSYTRRLVDENSRWDTYWVVDTGGNAGLMFDCGNLGNPMIKTPKLKEMKVEYLSLASDNFQILFLLKDSNYKDTFFQFCNGLLDAIESKETVQQAAFEAIEYTWQWYRLLKGESPDILSPEAQRGLIGELIYLRDHLVPALSWKEALDSWTGPFGKPKDFAWNDTAVEVKTHLTDARPFLKISSEFQLDTLNPGKLWLFVLEFRKATDTDSSSRTVSELVTEIFEEINNNSPDVADSLNTHLLASGYSRKHDYSGYRWIWRNPVLFEVTEDFPAIRSAVLPHGVSNVSYQISITACTPFKVDCGREFSKGV